MSTAFLFPGQGSQHVGMGLDLYEVEPASRAVFDRADELLGFPLSTLCFEGPEETLTDTANQQPALLVNSIAMLQAMEVNQLSMAKLSFEGIPPKLAMQKFSDWIHDSITKNSQPLFTAFNAPFDWMFVNEYFHRYLGSNPSGHSALDIKAFYMGLHAVTWQETSIKEISKKYCEEQELTHHALSDAIHEAALFQVLLNEANK